MLQHAALEGAAIAAVALTAGIAAPLGIGAAAAAAGAEGAIVGGVSVHLSAKIDEREVEPKEFLSAVLCGGAGGAIAGMNAGLQYQADAAAAAAEAVAQAAKSTAAADAAAAAAEVANAPGAAGRAIPRGEAGGGITPEMAESFREFWRAVEADPVAEVAQAAKSTAAADAAFGEFWRAVDAKFARAAEKAAAVDAAAAAAESVGEFLNTAEARAVWETGASIPGEVVVREVIGRYVARPREYFPKAKFPRNGEWGAVYKDFSGACAKLMGEGAFDFYEFDINSKINGLRGTYRMVLAFEKGKHAATDGFRGYKQAFFTHDHYHTFVPVSINF